MVEKDESIEIQESMTNAYLILTGKKSFDDLFESTPSIIYVAFDPEMKTREPEEVFDNVIEYFEYEEDYEKCKELLDIKNRMLKTKKKLLKSNKKK
jgi:hypothetical protein